MMNEKHADVKRVRVKFICVFIFFILLGMVISWRRGQDVNWDLLNYHLYNPWAFLNHINYYYSAGIQGYFDPFLDFPYYWLATGPLRAHPELLQALCGLPYGFFLFELFLLASLAAKSISTTKKWDRHVLVWSMVLLAGSGSAIWVQVGTTTNEITVATVTLLAFLILFEGFRKNESRAANLIRASVVGMCLGLAVGLKLTAGVYLPAVGVFYLITQRRFSERIFLATAYSVAAALMFCFSYGPWAVHLYRLTGNPFFPMFNNFFHSGMGSVLSTGRDGRFLPRNFWQWLFYPFFWISSNSGLIFELPFRDPRFAASYLTLIFLFVSLITSREARGLLEKHKLINGITIISVLSYVIWIMMFSILRYSIVFESTLCISMLAIIYIFAQSATTKFKAITIDPVVLVILVSSCLTFYGRISELGHVKYGNVVYDISAFELPSGALVVFANQPMGFLAPLIAEKHANVEFVGIPSSFGVGSKSFRHFYHFGLGERMRSVLAEHSSRLFVAYYSSRQPKFAGLNAFGVKVNLSECETMNSNVAGAVDICRAEFHSVFDERGRPLWR